MTIMPPSCQYVAWQCSQDTDCNKFRGGNTHIVDVLVYVGLAVMMCCCYIAVYGL